MRDMAQRGWQHWRVTLAVGAAAEPAGGRFTRVPLTTPAAVPLSATAEEPGPDGIRHELVARVRLAIEAGHYDRDDIWERAEAKLLGDVERGL